MKHVEFDKLVTHKHEYVGMPDEFCDCEPRCEPACCSDEPEFTRRWGAIEALEWALTVIAHDVCFDEEVRKRIAELKAQAADSSVDPARPE